MRVYIAGPPYANEYRERAIDLLNEAGLDPVNPMERDFRGIEVGNEAAIVDRPPAPPPPLRRDRADRPGRLPLVCGQRMLPGIR